METDNLKRNRLDSHFGENQAYYDKRNIESFDLLYVTTTSIFSKLINFAQYYINGTQGRYSHVSVCIWGSVFPDNTVLKQNDAQFEINKNELYLLESVINTEQEGSNIFDEYFNGVQIRKFDDVYPNYLKLVKSGTITEIMLTKLKYTNMNIIKSAFMNPDFKYRFLDFINRYNGTNYNYGLIDRVYISMHNYQIVSYMKYINDYIFGENKGMLCTELVTLLFQMFNIIEPNKNTKHFMPEYFLKLCEAHICIK